MLLFVTSIQYQQHDNTPLPILRGRSQYVASGVLLAFFKTELGALLLDHHSRGAAGRNRPLNAAALMKEKIPIPPLSVQQRIEELVLREARFGDSVRNLMETIREYRTRLAADVVTGKIDVRGVAANLPDLLEEGPTSESDDLSDELDLDEATEFTAEEADA